jgi:hypothetical protein
VFTRAHISKLIYQENNLVHYPYKRMNICRLFSVYKKYIHTGKLHKIFWLENRKGRDHSDDLGTDGMIIFRIDLRKIGWEGMD